MTIDLNSAAPVAGESAMRIRDILLRSRGAFREDWLSEKFRYDRPRAEEIAEAMELAGYVYRDREREQRNNSTFPWYSATDAGRDFTRASAAKRIKRETATKALFRIHKASSTRECQSQILVLSSDVLLFLEAFFNIETAWATLMWRWTSSPE